MLFRLVLPQCDDPVFWQSLIWELKVQGSEGNMASSFVCLCVCSHVHPRPFGLMSRCFSAEDWCAIKKACYFSTHPWACEKLEAHLILLVKVFLIRARFFSPFVPAEDRHPSSELKRRLLWPAPATTEHSTKPLFISLSYFWSVYLLAHR